MRKIRDVLRYRHSTDLSLESIARALNISKGVVAKYLKLAADVGLGWPLATDLDDDALERRLYSQPSARASASVGDAAFQYTVILPARPRKPQDKAKVEVGVQVVERWIMARLRHRQFFSVAELDVAVTELLPALNNRPFKKLPGCRTDAFKKLDAPYLRALPATRFVLADWKRAGVNIDYHVEYDGHYYSVPVIHRCPYASHGALRGVGG